MQIANPSPKADSAAGLGHGRRTTLSVAKTFSELDREGENDRGVLEWSGGRTSGTDYRSRGGRTLG